MRWRTRRILNGCAAQQLVARRDGIAPEFISYGLVTRAINRKCSGRFSVGAPNVVYKRGHELLITRQVPVHSLPVLVHHNAGQSVWVCGQVRCPRKILKTILKSKQILFLEKTLAQIR